MQAQRLLLKTNTQGKLEGLPDFSPNQDVEIIMLFNEVPPRIGITANLQKAACRIGR